MHISLVNHKQFEKLYYIKFNKPITRLHWNGFISVTVDWRCRKKTEASSWFKYVVLSHKAYGGSYRTKNKNYINVASACFEFPDLPAEACAELTPPWFDVCMGELTDHEADNNNYRVVFTENTKYGVIVWFAVNNWEQWDSAVELQNA